MDRIFAGDYFLGDFDFLVLLVILRGDILLGEPAWDDLGLVRAVAEKPLD